MVQFQHKLTGIGLRNKHNKSCDASSAHRQVDHWDENSFYSAKPLLCYCIFIIATVLLYICDKFNMIFMRNVA